MSIAEQKASLRRQLKERLASLTERRRIEADRVIHDRVLAQPEIEAADGVFTCWSFGTEVDTRRLVASLLERGKRVFLPRVRDGDREMFVHEYPCEMQPYRWGLEQPAETVPVVEPSEFYEAFQVALLLGLGFDDHGYRLGYGGGYFDRFLPDAAFLAFGLAYREQVIPALPTEAHDIALDRIISA